MLVGAPRTRPVGHEPDRSRSPRAARQVARLAGVEPAESETAETGAVSAATGGGADTVTPAGRELALGAGQEGGAKRDTPVSEIATGPRTESGAMRATPAGQSSEPQGPGRSIIPQGPVGEPADRTEGEVTCLHQGRYP